MDTIQGLLLTFAVLTCVGLVLMLFAETLYKAKKEEIGDRYFAAGTYITIACIAVMVVLIIVGTALRLMK